VSHRSIIYANINNGLLRDKSADVALVAAELMIAEGCGIVGRVPE
jgi:hypothetical protein